jgi:hypothetical protein
MEFFAHRSGWDAQRPDKYFFEQNLSDSEGVLKGFKSFTSNSSCSDFMEVVEKRTFEDYQQFRTVYEELKFLETVISNLDNTTWIHNHVVDAVKKVDETILHGYGDLVGKNVRLGVHDEVIDFLTWMDSWKEDEKISEQVMKHLNSDKIYKSFLDDVKKVKEKLPETLEKLGKLKMDKSKFISRVVSFEFLGTWGPDINDTKGVKESDHDVNYLYQVLMILPKLEELTKNLSEDYESFQSKFDRVDTLYRWFHYKRKELTKFEDVISSIKDGVKQEIELLDEKIEEVKLRKQEHERIGRKSDIEITWDGDYVWINHGKGILSQIPVETLEKGENYSITRRMEFMDDVNVIIEKKGKVVMMGSTFYRDANGRLTSNAEVNLDQALLNCIPEPIYIPSGAVEPQGWVKQEAELIKNMNRVIVDYLKSRNAFSDQKGIHYEDIFISVCNTSGLDAYDLKEYFLNPLVEEGRLAKDGEVYFLANSKILSVA